MPAAPKMMASPTLLMSGQDWSTLFVLSVLWGGTFFFAKIALAALPPMTLVFCRVLVGALALIVFMRLAGIAMPSGQSAWLAFFVMGLLNNVLPFGLIFWGQSAMPADNAVSLAAILNATTPVFGVLVAHVMTRDEKLTPARFVGVCLGFAGAAVVIFPRLNLASLALDRSMLGMMACLLAALVYCFASLYGRQFKTMQIVPVQVAFGQLAASSLIMAPVSLFVDHPWQLPLPQWQPVVAVLALGIVSTALAYILFFQLLASAGATSILLVTFLIPISAIILGWLFLSEQVGIPHLVGMCLIGLGLVTIDGRALKWLQKI